MKVNDFLQYCNFLANNYDLTYDEFRSLIKNEDVLNVVRNLWAFQDIDVINVQGFIDSHNAFLTALLTSDAISDSNAYKNVCKENDFICMKRSELLKLNRIVCTDCVNDVPYGYDFIGKWKDIDERISSAAVSREDVEFAKSIYSILPPFEEGVYDVELNNMKGFSGKKGKSYFHYKVVDVDSYNQSFSMVVEEYHRKNCAGIGCWVRDYTATINASSEHYSESINVDCHVRAPELEAKRCSQVLVRPTKEKIDLLTQVFELNNHDILNYMKGFSKIVRVSNYIIGNNSPKTKYTRSSTPRTSRTASTAYVEAENTISPPVTRIYADSALSVVSKQKPKRITPENIRKVYKTLAWDRRGHVRQYKSGKTVWVKQTTCHRQGGDDKDVKPRTIKIEGCDR